MGGNTVEYITGLIHRNAFSHKMLSQSQQKRSFEKAFERKRLDQVTIGDFCIENTVFKVLSGVNGFFDIKTSRNSKFNYGISVIKETSTSATIFSEEEQVTKTHLIQLFSTISINHIWTAEFYKYDTDKSWSEKLVTKIQQMEKGVAIDYVKRDISKFGKISRALKGQKLSVSSDNNYYHVRDLEIYFEELEKSSNIANAAKKSIRNLDVNTIQSLIFNGVKYTLK